MTDTDYVRARAALERDHARAVVGAAPDRFSGLYRYVTVDLVNEYLIDGWTIVAPASAHSLIMRAPQ